MRLLVYLAVALAFLHLTSAADSFSTGASTNVVPGKLMVNGALSAASGAFTNSLTLNGVGVATGTTPTRANPTATIGLTVVNGSAATFTSSDGAPPLSQAIVPSWTGLHTFGAALAATDITSGGFAVNRGTLTQASGVVTIDFSQTNRYWSCTLTGNVTFAYSNPSAGKWANILLYMPSTNCTPTFNLPAGTTNWFGGAPSTLTGGTVGSLSFYPIDATTNSTKAAYTETQ